MAGYRHEVTSRRKAAYGRAPWVGSLGNTNTFFVQPAATITSHGNIFLNSLAQNSSRMWYWASGGQAPPRFPPDLSGAAAMPPSDSDKHPSSFIFSHDASVASFLPDDLRPLSPLSTLNILKDGKECTRGWKDGREDRDGLRLSTGNRA